MYGLRKTIREAIIALKHEDPDDNFTILSNKDGSYIIKVLWTTKREEIIEIKLNEKK
ncbi:MAG: hypothetical protein WC437_04740 [Patescibacteria group bacterium]